MLSEMGTGKVALNTWSTGTVSHYLLRGGDFFPNFVVWPYPGFAYPATSRQVLLIVVQKTQSPCRMKAATPFAKARAVSPLCRLSVRAGALSRAFKALREVKSATDLVSILLHRAAPRLVIRLETASF